MCCRTQEISQIEQIFEKLHEFIELNFFASTKFARLYISVAWHVVTIVVVASNILLLSKVTRACCHETSGNGAQSRHTYTNVHMNEWILPRAPNIAGRMSAVVVAGVCRQPAKACQQQNCKLQKKYSQRKIGNIFANNKHVKQQTLPGGRFSGTGQTALALAQKITCFLAEITVLVYVFRWKEAAISRSLPPKHILKCAVADYKRAVTRRTAQFLILRHNCVLLSLLLFFMLTDLVPNIAHTYNYTYVGRTLTRTFEIAIYIFLHPSAMKNRAQIPS